MTTSTQTQIDFKAEAEALRAELVARRRDFHRHPELAFEEVRTARIIAEELSQLGLEVQTGIAKTGVVAILEGAHDGPTVLYRADMDALPIHEQNEHDFVSLEEGKMHACGHDGHMAIALAVARLMSKYREKIHGRIKFVFQPGEEGAGGALAMLSENILEDPAPDYAFGMHLWQPLHLGQVGIARGPIMSGSSVFRIIVKGKGGHAAMPHTTIDPVACTGQLVTALHTIVGRRMNAMDGAVVLSVTGLKTSAMRHNIIPETVEIMGTFRTFNALTSELLEQHVRDVAFNVCESVGCKSDVQIKHLTIPVVNDPRVTRQMRDALQDVIPAQQLQDDTRTMASEDMSYLLDEVPGVFFLVGSSNPKKGLDYGHHHPRFDFDEDALPLGVSVMSRAIAEYVLPQPGS